jgi:hypothetical protein
MIDSDLTAVLVGLKKPSKAAASGGVGALPRFLNTIAVSNTVYFDNIWLSPLLKVINHNEVFIQ